MNELENLGIKVERRFQSTSFSVNGLPASTSETTKLILTLPRALAVKASFSREGLGKKLVKLFKKEIQTGDKGFDQAIYISTDTPDATSALLASPDVRRAIAECVWSWAEGMVDIDGAVVTTELKGRVESGADPSTVALVRILLG